MPIESLAIYACEDADITLRLWTKLQDSLDQQGLREVFDQIEMPLLPVLAQMEYRGITVDRDMLDTYSMELGNQLTEMAQSIYTFAGMEFNINSPKQLGEVLFDLLKISEKPKKLKPDNIKPMRKYSTSYVQNTRSFPRYLPTDN